ncbi:hypothetical protein D3C84_1095330 [compost metagenome]
MGESALLQGSAHAETGQGHGSALDVQFIGELAAANQHMVQTQQQTVDVQFTQVFAVFNVEMRHCRGPELRNVATDYLNHGTRQIRLSS